MVSDQPPARTRRRRILVVIAIALALTLLPISSVGAWASNAALLARCGKNQSQLMGACVAYWQQAHPYVWPSFPDLEAHQSALTVNDAHQARLVTVAIMANLSFLEDVPPANFSCPALPGRGPKMPYSPKAQSVAAWGAALDASVAYAIEWTADYDVAPASEILMADRDPRHHHGTVVVCFGDWHTAALRGYDPDPILPAAGMRTESEDGHPVPLTRIPASQDIYAPAPGDLLHQLIQGGSQLDHSWVK